MKKSISTKQLYEHYASLEISIIESRDSNDIIESYLQAAIKSKDALLIAMYRLLVGIKYFYLGNYSQAKIFIEETEVDSLQNDLLINKYNYWKAAMSYMNGQKVEVITLTQQCIHYFTNHPNDTYKYLCLNLQGSLFSAIGLYDEALMLLEQCSYYFKSQQKIPKYILNQLQIGNTLCSLKKFEKSASVFLETFELYQDIFDTRPLLFQCNYFHHLGNLYMLWHKHEEALSYYDKIIKVLDQIEHPYFKASFNNTLGHYYIEIKDFKKAKKYLETGLAIALTIQSSVLQLYIYQNLSEIEVQNKAYKKAITILRKALDISLLGNFGLIQASIHQRLANCYKAIDDFKHAMLHIEKDLFIKEELFSTESDIRIEAISALNEIKRKEQQLKEAEKEIALKSQELELNTLYLNQKNQLLHDIEFFVNSLKKENYKKQKIFNSITNKLKSVRINNVENTAFKEKYLSQNKDLILQLQKDYPTITKSEAQLAGLIAKGLSSKEIADIMVIELRSVEMSRYRLRKKLNLDKKVDLSIFLNKLLFE